MNEIKAESPERPAWVQVLLEGLVETFELIGSLTTEATFDANESECWVIRVYPTVMNTEDGKEPVFPEVRRIDIGEVLTLIDDTETRHITAVDGQVRIDATCKGESVVLQLYTTPPEDAESEGIIHPNGTYTLYKDFSVEGIPKC